MDSFSIVVPIYNEEKILKKCIVTLYKKLSKEYRKFELLLVENGSTDQTLQIGRELCTKYPQLKLISLPFPSFGVAVREGIAKARFSIIVIYNADWWDVEFLKRAHKMLGKNTMVVGSKRLDTRKDKRPFIRKLGSFVFVLILKKGFNYGGSDTHGIKMFRKNEIVPLLKQCVTLEIIESELLVRAKREGFTIKEIPVAIREIRPPRIGFWYRSVKVIKELVLLHNVLR